MTSASHAWRLLAASLVAVSASAQAPAAPVAQAPSICGNQPLCYEAPDFAATITDFRTSGQGRIVDIGVRFTNKTNGLLVLGYTNGSGVATDDRGNRYVVWGGNGVRGMGLVNGQSVDPKFQIRPGGYSDAKFELGLQGYPQVIGFTFELDVSVNEVNVYQGNQFTVGSEFPLTWKGLQNGATGAAPGAVAYAGGAGAGSGTAGGTIASIPCQNGTVQNVANGANTAAANVSAAVSSIGSLFGRKQKQQQPDASASGPTVPCTPATGTTGTPATTTTTSTGTVATPAAPATTAARPTATTGAKPAVTNATTAAKPVATAPAAKPAAPQAAVTTTPAKKVTPPATTPPATTPPAQSKP